LQLQPRKKQQEAGLINICWTITSNSAPRPSIALFTHLGLLGMLQTGGQVLAGAKEISAGSTHSLK
jgi:hypothetical protein